MAAKADGYGPNTDTAHVLMQHVRVRFTSCRGNDDRNGDQCNREDLVNVEG